MQLHASQLPNLRESPVSTDDQIGTDFTHAVLGPIAHAKHLAVLLDQLLHPRSHREMKRRIAARLIHEQLDESRLWDLVAVRILRVGHRLGGRRDAAVRKVRWEVSQFGVRQLEQPLEKPELLQQLERGRMHRVAAEVTFEVAVRFEQHDLDALPSQKQRQDRPGWAAADDAAFDVRRRRCRLVLHGPSIDRARANLHT